MANDWQELPLSEAVLVNPTTSLERGKIYPFVEMSAVSAGTRDVKCSEQREFTGGGSKFRDRDTLMARITPCLENGKIARFQAPKGQPIGHGSTEFIVIRGRPNVSDNDFAYYLTISPEVRHFAISQMTGSSGRQRVPTDALDAISISLPSLPEQKAIAAVLGALDDKIELNRRMNVTLEAMAQTLFKNWFVDAAAGKLPAGWREGPILEVAKLLSGGTPKTEREDYWGGDILWASAKDVSQCGQTFLVTTERTITKKGLEESATQLIPAFCTVVVARGATTGRMTMFGREIAMNQTCYALASTTGTPFALYCLFRYVIDDLVQTAHGSVFDTITTSTFASSKVILPPQRVFEAFEMTVAPIFALILSNIEESGRLAGLRDTLLPKLLSGELSVTELIQPD